MSSAARGEARPTPGNREVGQISTGTQAKGGSVFKRR